MPIGVHVDVETVKTVRRMRAEGMTWTKISMFFGKKRSWASNLMDRNVVSGGVVKKRGRARKTSDGFEDILRHVAIDRRSRTWPAEEINKVVQSCEVATNGPAVTVSKRTIQRRLQAMKARIVRTVKDPLTYHHRTMRILWALEMLEDKLKRNKNYFHQVLFSDEASAKFDCGRHTVSLLSIKRETIVRRM